MKALRICRVCEADAIDEEELIDFKRDVQQPHGRQNLCIRCDNERKIQNYGVTFRVVPEDKSVKPFRVKATSYLDAGKQVYARGLRGYGLIKWTRGTRHD